MAAISGAINVYPIVNGSLGNGVVFAPQSATVELDSLASEDSGRDDNGNMHIQFIKSRYRKINITLAPNGNYGNILDIVQGRIYLIIYDDPITNQRRSTRVYTSKSSCKLYSGTINGGIWTSGSFSAIEMDGEV